MYPITWKVHINNIFGEKYHKHNWFTIYNSVRQPYV